MYDGNHHGAGLALHGHQRDYLLALSHTGSKLATVKVHHGQLAAYYRCILQLGEVQPNRAAAFCRTSARCASPVSQSLRPDARRCRARCGSCLPLFGQTPDAEAQHFRKVKHRFRGRRSIARSSTASVAGAASQGQVQMPWQAQQLRKVTCRFRGRRSGAATSQGQVQIS